MPKAAYAEQGRQSAFITIGCIRRFDLSGTANNPNSGGSSTADARNPSMQEQAENLVAAIRIMEGELQNAIASEEAATRSRAASVSAIESVRQILDGAKGAEPSEALLGIGGGVFVQTRIPAPDKMLLEIGSEVVVEKKSADVLNYLENRIREIDIVIKNTEATKANLVNHIEQYRMQLNHMMQATYRGQEQIRHV